MFGKDLFVDDVCFRFHLTLTQGEVPVLKVENTNGGVVAARNLSTGELEKISFEERVVKLAM